MKKLVISPRDWPCTLSDCPAGLFVFGDTLCLKSEYRTNGRTDAYIADSGESFQGGVTSDVEREALIVQPCQYIWFEE